MIFSAVMTFPSHLFYESNSNERAEVENINQKYQNIAGNINESNGIEEIDV